MLLFSGLNKPQRQVFKPLIKKTYTYMEYPMKKVFLAAAVMAALVSGNVMADTITINGEIIENGCTIGNNGNADLNLNKITVPQVKAAAIGAHLANQADSFKISNCPNYSVFIEFIGDEVPGMPDSIVNTESPSNTVLGHYLFNNDNEDTLVGFTAVVGGPQAQSAAGMQYPVNVGYVKIAEVDDQDSPAGVTKSVVTLNVTYRQ